MTITFWDGEKGRPLRVHQPCPCGCDTRNGDWRPYITASDEDGNGVTIRMEQEDIDELRDQIRRLQ